jgi:hypothetical protein
MKNLFLAAFLFTFTALAIAQEAAKPHAPPITAQVEVYFSPKGGCTEAVVKQIDAAKKTIHVQAYSFTSGADRQGPRRSPQAGHSGSRDSR